MTDREIVIYLAERVMGWEVRNVDAVSGSKDVIAIRDASGRDKIWYPGCGCRYWNPLECIADAFEVQSAFLYLGPNKRRRFTQSLNRIAWNENSPGFGRDWAMVGATARQRCLAIVEATK